MWEKNRKSNRSGGWRKKRENYKKTGKANHPVKWQKKAKTRNCFALRKSTFSKSGFAIPHTDVTCMAGTVFMSEISLTKYLYQIPWQNQKTPQLNFKLIEPFSTLFLKQNAQIPTPDHKIRTDKMVETFHQGDTTYESRIPTPRHWRPNMFVPKYRVSKLCQKNMSGIGSEFMSVWCVRIYVKLSLQCHEMSRSHVRISFERTMSAFVQDLCHICQTFFAGWGSLEAT